MNRKRYETDLSEAEWAVLESHVPLPRHRGRPLTHSRREIINAILSIVVGGCQWRLLPHDLPPWKTVHHYFRVWRLDGTWETLLTTLREETRQRAGRDPEPTAAIIDTQSVKTTSIGGPERGFDGGKKVTGRKRHILVDTAGLLLLVVVHSAALSDQAGAKRLMARAFDRFAQLRLIWADGTYAGYEFETWVTKTYTWILRIVQRPKGVKGFTLLPRRWVVERTFGWWGRWRRLSKESERDPETSAAIIYLTMTRIMLKRLARLAL